MSRQTVVGIMGTAALLLVAVPAFATSHVRIVRLSYLDGTVQIRQWSKARALSPEETGSPKLNSRTTLLSA